MSCRAVSLMNGRHSPWSPMGMPPPAFAVVFHALTAGGFPPLLVPDPPYVSTDPCAGLRSYHRRDAAYRLIRTILNHIFGEALEHHVEMRASLDAMRCHKSLILKPRNVERLIANSLNTGNPSRISTME